MAFVRTKAGTLRLVHEGREFLLDSVGQDLPDDLAKSILSHVNVTDEPVPAALAQPDPPKAEEPVAQAGRKKAEKPE